MAATAGAPHDALVARGAKEGQELMDIVAPPRGRALRHALLESLRSAREDRAQAPEHHPTGPAAPTPIASPR